MRSKLPNVLKLLELEQADQDFEDYFNGLHVVELLYYTNSIEKELRKGQAAQALMKLLLELDRDMKYSSRYYRVTKLGRTSARKL